MANLVEMKQFVQAVSMDMDERSKLEDMTDKTTLTSIAVAWKVSKKWPHTLNGKQVGELGNKDASRQFVGQLGILDAADAHTNHLAVQAAGCPRPYYSPHKTGGGGAYPGGAASNSGLELVPSMLERHLATTDSNEKGDIKALLEALRERLKDRKENTKSEAVDYAVQNLL